MFVIDPLTVSSVLILAGNVAVCPAHPPTKINIVPRSEKVEYDYSQTLKEIQNYSTDTVDPYGFHGTTVTQGFMKGTVQLEHGIKFGHHIDKKHGFVCLWYEEITVKLHIDPTIVIAKELYKDKCMRKAILGHELKHVRVDRQIVNKYAKLMGGKLVKALTSRGFSAAPIEAHRIKEVSRKMQRVVEQILMLENQKMNIDRQERQREVDSLEEYNSVDDKCPGFAKKKEKLYSDLVR